MNTILNSRRGSFSLGSTEPPFTFTGRYEVTPDYTLTLTYDQFALPGTGTVSRSESWLKESDSPRH